MRQCCASTTAPAVCAGRSSVVAAAMVVVVTSSCTSESLAPSRVSLLTPQDTVIVLGGSYLVDGDAIYADGSRGPVTLQSLDPSVVSAQGTRVTGEGLGRAQVVAAGGLDTLWVTVVPDATMAAWVPGEGLFVFRSDLTESEQLFGEGDPGFAPGAAAIADWDPAGHRVLYSANGGIYFVAINGQIRRVDLPISDTAMSAGSFPQMTADTAWIYFSAYNSYRNRSEIWRVRTNASDPARVGRIPPIGNYDGVPSPSPNGDRVAILTDTPGNFSLLDILDPATGDVDPTGIPARFARWSPVDDRIAYADENEELRVLDLMTSQTRPIVTDATISHDRLYFDWSPDGEFLITTVARPTLTAAEGNGGLEIIEVDTGIRMPIANSQGLSHPAWGPTP